MVFPTMRLPRDRAPHAPGGGGRVLVVGSVHLGLGRTLPRLRRGAADDAFPGALAAPLASGLAVPTA